MYVHIMAHLWWSEENLQKSVFLPLRGLWGIELRLSGMAESFSTL